MSDLIKKIGVSNSPVVMDYSSLQAWEDDTSSLSAPNDLVASDVRYIGECYDQGTFTAGVTISGETTDATRYMFLRCAPGASFKDKAGVRTTALLYNSANGVTIETSGTAIGGTASFTHFEGLQAKRTAYGGAGGWSLGSMAGLDMNQCISGDSGDSIGQNTTAKVRNCLFQVPSGGHGSTGQAQFYNCTCVCVANDGTYGVGSSYNAAKLTNCAVFGFANVCSGGTTLAAGSDYNATDLTAPTNWGSHSLASKTYASQFVSTSTDFRAVVTGDLKAGTPDSTNAPTDISGTARDATTPYIGCWEVAGGGGATRTPRMTLLGVGP